MKRLVAGLCLVSLFSSISLGITPYATQVVAKGTFLNKVGVFPTTTIYTPSTTGNFRVSVYLICPGVTVGASEIYVVPSWFDGVATFPNSLEKIVIGYAPTPLKNSPGQEPFYAGGSIVIHAVAGHPIHLIDFGTNDLTDPYDVYFVVEKL